MAIQRLRGWIAALPSGARNDEGSSFGRRRVSADREAKVRDSFAEQAYWCDRLGSAFTARLCRLLGERLGHESSVGRKVLDWPGNPLPTADALALRLCAGLHWLVRRGEAPDLSRLYPPAPLPDEDCLWAELAAILEDRSDTLNGWLARAPQTNEVGRAALLMAGLLVLARRFPLPIRLYEPGASAGLNLVLDRYGYLLGNLRAGDPRSPLQLEPEWKGPDPPASAVRIVGREGADLNPARLPDDRDRLIAYVWPDQPRRLRQIETALGLAAADPPPLVNADAADWIERRLALAPEAGTIRVVMHSVAFQYFSPEVQDRVAAHVAAAGARASDSAPVAWLRFEKLPGDPRYSLRLRTWPGDDRLLAWAHPHGTSVRWLGD